MTSANGPTIPVVGVVGVGVVGRSWARLFAQMGCRTRLYDPDPGQARSAMNWLSSDLEADREMGLLDDHVTEATLARVTVHDSLGDALDGVGYVQESGPERLSSKQRVFAELDGLAPPAAILASSTSTYDMTRIAGDLPGSWRFVTAHPVNPPHVIPVVEVVPGRATTPEVLERTVAFLRSIGQDPVVLNRYLFGFLLNRMQAALIREAIHLVRHGFADVDAVDSVIRNGLGLRWALMGPFGVANTNADAGIREYFSRFGSSYTKLMRDLGDTPAFDEELIESLAAQTDAMTGAVDLAAVRRWRDDMVRKIRQLKRSNGLGGSAELAIAEARSPGAEPREDG